MTVYHLEDIRNLAVVGHGGAGKTSLTDALLFKSGTVERHGLVDDGTSFSDFDDQEKERHFSIDTSFVHFAYNGEQVHILDTPGYPDFVGAALEALNVVENALIVISASDGIQPNTRKMFEQAGEMNLGRMLVINKLDHDNSSFVQLYNHIRETFGENCVLFNVPVGEGSNFSSVVNVLNPPDDLPEGCLLDPNELRSELVDDIVESNEELMEKYLEEGDVSDEELIAAMPNALASRTIVPIFCVSAMKEIGIDELLEGVSEFALSPLHAPDRKAILHKDDGDEEMLLHPNENGECLGQVFKIHHDKFVGTLTYFRLFSGRLKADQPIINHRTGKTHKTNGLWMMQGKEHENVDEAIAGDIVAVTKIDDLHIGDTIGNNGTKVDFPILKVPQPMFGLAIEPKARGDEQKISSSLQKMADEDPTFLVSRDEQTHELLISGMSQLHLEVIRDRLKRRYNLEVITHEPKIPYHETITSDAEASYKHKKQTGGRGQFAEVHIRLYPLSGEIATAEQFFEEFANKARFEKIRLDHCHYDPDHNFGFIDTVVGGVISSGFLPAIRKGCEELLNRGPLAGCLMQDMAVEVHFGKEHSVDSSEAAFKIAGRKAFREAVLKANPVLMEPYVDMEVTVPAEYTGAVLGDLNNKRARIDNQDTLPGDMSLIHCKIPLAEVTRYEAQLKSMTHGLASYTMQWSHYDLVPMNVQQKIVQEAGITEEEDE